MTTSEHGSIESLPYSKKIAYALGQLGWSLASYGAANYLNYFYLPPKESGSVIFPRMIQQGYVVGFLTLIGLILWFGRAFDAVTDPLVAWLSDKSKMKLGRRRSFLAMSVVPFSLMSFLVFFSPGGAGDSANIVLNGIWLFATVTMLYWFMTMYVTPFFAWMSELGHTPNERLQLSTMISITWALGAVIGSQAPLFQSILQARGFSALTSFRLVMGAFSVISLILMLLPVIFIDEKRYSSTQASDDSMFVSMKDVLKDRNFLVFTFSDFAYWVSLYFINNGLLYYVTVLLGLPKEVYSNLFIIMFLLSFVFYIPVNLVAKKTGKRKLLIIAFIIFSLVFVWCSLFGTLPIPAMAQALIAAIGAALPLAIFGILPNAMIADMAEAHARTTGSYRAGIYFGFRTFMSKMGQSVGALLLPSLVMIGASQVNQDIVGAQGVRITTFFAFGFCVLGFILLLKYSEKKVLTDLGEEKQAKEKPELRS